MHMKLTPHDTDKVRTVGTSSYPPRCGGPPELEPDGRSLGHLLV